MKSKSNLLLAVLFIPVLGVSCYTNSNFVDKFIPPKEYYLYFTSTIFIIASFLTPLFNKREIHLKLDVIDVLFLLYYAYCFVNLLIRRESLNDSQFKILTILVILFFLLKKMFAEENNDKAIKIILLALMSFAAIQVFSGILQMCGITKNALSIFKVAGSFGNPGPYSNYLVSVLPISIIIGWLCKSNDKMDKVLRKTGFWLSIGIIVILPATRARTSWITALICVTVILLTSTHLKDKYKKIISNFFIKLALIIVLLFTTGIVAYYLYSFKKDSASGRLFTWQLTMKIIKDHPLTGTGFNTYAVTHNDYQAHYFANSNEHDKNRMLADNITYTFNEYLQITSELGIIGLLLFLFILAAAFYYSPKIGEMQLVQRSFFIALVPVLICALFSYPFHDVPTFLNFIVFLAFLPISKNKNIISFKISSSVTRLIAFLSIVAVLVFINGKHQSYEANKKWKTAVQINRSGNKEEAFQIYKEVYPVLSHDGLFLYNYGSELALAGYYPQSLQILHEALNWINDADIYSYLGEDYERINDLKNAEQAFQHASYIIPHKLYPLYRLVNIYAKQEQMEKALKLAKKVVSMNEKVKSAVTDQIKSDLHRFIMQVEQNKPGSNAD